MAQECVATAFALHFHFLQLRPDRDLESGGRNENPQL